MESPRLSRASVLTHRTIYCNDPRAGLQTFKGNAVSTTKYSLFSFLPKGLFEQFRRVANLYFLLIAILSTTPVSPLHPITNVTPLVLVLAISLMKEAFEDRKRYKSDIIINSSLTEILRGNEWVTIPWKDVRVGDVVRVRANHYFPADLLCLASTNSDGICYIETSNLDGETNLKIRKALERTWDYITADSLSEFRGLIECEPPNNSLYTFTGNLVIGKQTLPISPNQILLRGCSLRNTEWVVGAVIFTGHETKVMMNTMDVPSKRSTLEKRLDLVIIILFGVLFGLCLIGSIGSAVLMDKKFWYLSLDSSSQPEFNANNKLGVLFLSFFTLLTLFATIIPISLYVSIEMIKFIQSTQFINKDLNMYDPETQTPALSRTSNLNEELGQVEYIFTDKTGTLTQNKMEFFKCSIGGVMYGTGVTEVQKMISKKSGNSISLDPSTDEQFLHEKGFNFNDKRLMRGAWRQEPSAEVCKEFFRLLAICHTVLPEGNETPDAIKYLASSPDEAAMVAAAKNFGFFFYRRTPTSVRVREMHVEKLGRAQDLEYEILNVLEFSSSRKRQSIIARFPNGRLVLYCKGADNVIFERLSKSGNKYKEVTRQHLEKFGADGLRTLCLAYRDLDEKFYEEWNKKFVTSRSVLRDREKKLEETYELIEKELILLGCTAIEDKLQEGVSNCIEVLQRAGLKFWVLTGDKLETAINIAYACSLLNNDMRQFIISSDTDEIREVEERGDMSEITRVIRESVFQQMREIIREAEVLHAEGFPIALIIDGRCLTHCLEPLMSSTLIELGLMCSTVICCRVSPLQKAQVTSLMKDNANKITLSIGDGANDVSMIQAAHVGVGISGNEGMQAVLASDFSIAQFRFLTDLLLVHGRWSYIRLSKVVGYFFYKNLAFTLTLFWFNCFAAFSGQRLYDDWFQSSFNVVFTALPVVAVGIFDQDVDAKRSKQYPELYRNGIENVYFSWKTLGLWLFFAIFHSLIFFFLPATAGKYFIAANGRILGIWDIGTMIYTIIIITVNFRLLMAVTFITSWHISSILISILLWFVLVFGYDAISPSSSVWSAQSNQYWVIYVLMSTSYFWLILLLVPVVALLPDFVYNCVQRRLYPYDYQIIQEDIKLHRFSEEFIERERILEMQALGELKTRPSIDTLRRQAMAALPALASKKHTGFAFDTPGFESFFAQQEGVNAPARAWDVARQASIRGRKSAQISELPVMSSFPSELPISSSFGSHSKRQIKNDEDPNIGTSRTR